LREWELRVAGMDEVTCRAMIQRLREKEMEGVAWNANTLRVYGMLKERIKWLREQRGVRLTSEYELKKREDDLRAQRKIEEECGGEVKVDVVGARPLGGRVRWEGEVAKRREWAQRRRAEREARRHW
jgi:hypothetical protein